MAGDLKYRHHWVFRAAALAVWIALGWPVLEKMMTGGTIRGSAVSPVWLIPFAIFGAAALAAMILKLRPSLHWTLASVQVAAVVAMTIVVPWAGMSSFLVITAWQVSMATTPDKALSWVAFQNLAVIATLAQALNPDLCWVLAKSFALQLLIVFTAQALRREAETARTLAETNRELRSAQAMLANTIRNAERLRISRELHDAWGHELTALGLQLEIASHVTEAGPAREHVVQAQSLSRALLGKVRDVVAHLRDEERCDLQNALKALAQSVPAPAVHVEVSSNIRVTADQAHAFMRCAQEAITNTIRHADATNLWLNVTSDEDGVRLIARNDGTAPVASVPEGSGLRGMRERLESLGGRLAVRAGDGPTFTLDAWLPLRSPLTA